MVETTQEKIEFMASPETAALKHGPVGSSSPSLMPGTTLGSALILVFCQSCVSLSLYILVQLSYLFGRKVALIDFSIQVFELAAVDDF